MYREAKKNPWEVNPFDVCRSTSGYKKVPYFVKGNTRQERDDNLLKLFYEIEEKHFKRTNCKGLITNKPKRSGPIYKDDTHEIIGWFVEGEFYCHIPERLKKVPSKEDDDAR